MSCSRLPTGCRQPLKVALEARVLWNKGRRSHGDESPSLPTSLRARTTPLALTVRRPVVRVLGSSKARDSLLADGQCGAIPDNRNHPYLRSRRAASGRSLSVMRPTLGYATHSHSLIVHAENALGTRAISDHASRMSQVIPTPASLRGASSFGCNKLPAVPVLDRKARNAAMASTSLQLSSQASANKRRL